MLEIRPETDADIEGISEVNKEAFGGGGGEAKLVESIRDSEGFIPELSLVADKDDKIVGHILFSKVKIKSENEPISALSLAPVAVSPEFQNQGIGALLIKRGLEVCGKLGYKIVVVIGHPEYYPRFGFIPARAKGLEVSFSAPIPDEAFMVLEIEPGALKGVRGFVEFPAAFDEAI